VTKLRSILSKIRGSSIQHAGVVKLCVGGYALLLVFTSVKGQVFLTGLLGSLLVISSSLLWGLRGGALSTAWATALIIWATLLTYPDVLMMNVYVGIGFYLVSGIGLGYWVDISREQRRRLFESEANYRSLADNTSDLIYSIDTRHQITAVNRSVCMVLRRDADTIIGRTILDLELPDSMAHKWHSFHQLVFDSRCTLDEEISALMPDGASHVYEIVLHPLFGEAGVLRGIRGTFRDITERRMEERLNLMQKDLALSISRTRDTGSALREVVRTALTLEEVDCAAICVVGDDQMLLDSLGQYPDLKVCRFGESGQIGLTLSDEPKYFHRSQAEDLPFDESMGDVKAMAFLPIAHASRTLACLGVGSHTCEEFPQHAKYVLETIVSQAGSAVAHIAAEEEIRRNQQNLQSFFDNIDEIVLVLGPEGRVLSANPGVYTRLGYTRSDIPHLSIYGLTPDSEHPEIREHLEQSKSLRGAHFHFRHKSGELVPVGMRLANGVWGNQSVMFCIARDITQQKQAEQAMKLASAVIESSSSVLMRRVLPGIGRITFVTQNVKQWGYSADSLVSDEMAYESILHPDDVALLYRRIEDSLASGRDRFLCSYRIVGANGNLYYVEDQSTFEESERPDRVFIQSVVSDVTERRLREAQDAHTTQISKAIEEISRSYEPKSTIETACLAASVLSGSEMSAFWEVQQSEKDVLAPLPAHTVGTDMSEIEMDAIRERAQRLWDDADAPRVSMEKVDHHGKTWYFCCAQIQSSQNKFGVLITLGTRPFDEEPRVLRSMAILGYVTSAILERQQSETLHSKLAVAEEQTRIARDIHDSVSQSLFSLVYGLQGTLSTLDAGDIAAARTKLETLRNIAASVSREIRTSIYRLSESSSEGAFVQAIRSYLAELSNLYSVATSLSVEGSEDNLSPAVRRAVWRVVREATSNALRHGESTQIKVSLHMQPLQIVVRVEDNGKGFTPPSENELLGQDTAQVANGGLGLLSMTSLARSFDGSLSIESQSGHGTRLTLRIPNLEHKKEVAGSDPSNGAR